MTINGRAFRLWHFHMVLQRLHFSQMPHSFFTVRICGETRETTLLVHARKSFTRLDQMFRTDRMHFISVGLNENEPDI